MGQEDDFGACFGKVGNRLLDSHSSLKVCLDLLLASASWLEKLRDIGLGGQAVSSGSIQPFSPSTIATYVVIKLQLINK